MQDEMLDLVEQGEELQQVLALGSGAQDFDDISETELDAELDALGDEQLYGDINLEGNTTGEIPSYLSGTIPQFVDEEPTREGEGKLETAT